MNFAALERLHRRLDCKYQQKKQLKRLGLINSDYSLTIHGKILLYSRMFDVSILSFKILSLCYSHKRSQRSETPFPVFYELVESFFGGKSTSNMYGSIKQLTEKNLTERYSCRSLIITDSAYNSLKQYDADIVDIECSFEY